MPEEKDLNAHMHTETRRDIAEIKKRAEERLQEFLTLKSDVRQVSKNLEHLDTRLNEGVSKTAFKTFEKVNEISVDLKEMGHRLEKVEEKSKTNTDHLMWLYRGIVFVIFVTIVIRYFFKG